MPRQTMPKRIRRCVICNEKTHQRFWNGPECPLCHSAEGFVESAHGGLAEKEIKEILEILERKQKETIRKGKERESI